MAVSQSLTLTCTNQNQVQNTSQVLIQWTSTQTGTSYNDTQRTAYYYVSVNGGAETQYSVNYTLPLQTTKTIVAATVTVPHNDKGEATVTVRTWMNTHISAGVVEQTKSLTLPTIARESTVSATSTMIMGSSVVAVNRKSSGFTHTVYLQFGSIKGYLKADGSLSGTAVKLTSTSITVPIGEEYYREIPTAQSGVVTLTCTTYSGDTQIGSPKTAKFTVYVDPEYNYPELDCSAEDVEQKTVEITEDEEIIISGCSTVRVYAKAQGLNYATIQSITVNGQKIVGEYLDIPNFSGTALTVTAVDSRGLTTSQTLPNTIIPYTKVTATASVERTDPTSGNAVLKVSGNWFSGNFDGRNGLDNALKIVYQISGGESVTVTDVTANTDGTYAGTATLSGLDYTKTHTVYVTVSDLLTGATQTLTVKKGVPVFDWGENDFAFHVPVTIMGNSVFGYIGGYIGKDFNDLILVNGYYASSSAPAENLGCSNYPVKETGMLIVLSHGKFTYQIYMTYDGNAYYRTNWNHVQGGWTSWKQIQMS